MKTWDDHLSWLRSRHPRLGDVEGKGVLAEAYRELIAAERWTFLVTEAMLTTEAEFTSGTVAVTANGTGIAFTAAPAAACPPEGCEHRVRPMAPRTDPRGARRRDRGASAGHREAGGARRR